MTSDLSDDRPSESLFVAPPMGEQERMVRLFYLPVQSQLR